MSGATISPAITLRSYQCEAVNAIYRHLRERNDNPCVVIPTGGGKTPVMSTICGDAVSLWDGRVLVLAHVRELLEQTAGTLRRMAPQLDVGVYSAGLRRRDTEHPVIVAGIQSVYKRACELDRFDLVIIDEAHMIPPEGDGMYRQFLAEAKVVNPHLRVIGLTATPYRMTSGMICAPENILNEVCFEVGVRELIVQGYLCPLRTKAGKVKVDTSGVHVRAGEFVASELENVMDDDHLVRAACAEVVELTRDRQSVLIFASGVQHGGHIVETLQREHGIECGFICGDTPSAERDRLIARFRRQSDAALFNRDAPPLRYLCNVNVLTMGFDAPNVDCVAMLRPTMSPGLFYQMVGRGFRLHPGKRDCIAESQRVLTDQGLVPIEQVTTAMRVWDGEAFVKHQGAFCRGVQQVIEYAGLCATPDHRVWTATGWKTFGQCALEQAPISVTGYGGTPVRETDRCFRDGASARFAGKTVAAGAMPDMRPGSTQGLHGPDAPDGRLPTMRSSEAGSALAVGQGGGRAAALSESSRSPLRGLWGPWHSVSVLNSQRHGPVGTGASGASSRQAIGPDRQQRPLRAGQPALRDGIGKPAEHSPQRLYRRVWDLLNAGPRHRFTCEDMLVSNCAILDFGGNVLRHGPVDAIRISEPGKGNGEAPAKECPECQAVIHAAYARCPECGHEFPPREREKHDATASTAGVLSGECSDTEYEVTEVHYTVHVKRDAPEDHPHTMRVDYRCGFNDYHSEWVCFEHTGYARAKAEAWWRARSDEPVPTTADEAVAICEAGGVCETKAITVRYVSGEKYARVVAYQLGARPPRLHGSEERDEGGSRLPEHIMPDDEVPF